MPSPFSRATAALAAAAALLLGPQPPVQAAAADGTPTPAQRNTAQRAAQVGVPLSELAPGAPDRHVVRPGDTLWDLSRLFLRSPWHWPELWGMNLEQVRNPHRIYPGQVLVLERSGDRARLRLGDAGEPPTVRLSPQVRSEPLPAQGAIGALPWRLIQPFLNEAVVLDDDTLAAAPRVVAGPDGRVIMARGDTVYVLGELGAARRWGVFRQAVPLRDPDDPQRILGWQARHAGQVEVLQEGSWATNAQGQSVPVPARVGVVQVREEIAVGDRLAPLPETDTDPYAPHAPAGPVDGRIAAIYGDALTAGQNQIVALNRGSDDGLERGHVLALWRQGALVRDPGDPRRRAQLKLPDERHGQLFVFRVFPHVAYALITQVQEPVRPGDRFSQP